MTTRPVAGSRNDVMPYQRVSHRADDLKTASLFFPENGSAGLSPLCPRVWHRLSFSSTHMPDNESLVAEATRFDRFSKNDGRFVSRFYAIITPFLRPRLRRDPFSAIIAKFLFHNRDTSPSSKADTRKCVLRSPPF